MRRLALLGAIALAAAGCGGSGRIPLETLAAKQQAYVGKRVTTSGTVLQEHDPSGKTYYVLGGAGGSLVGLLPAKRAARYVDAHVVVSGVFRIVPGFGRAIRVSRIERG